MTRTRTRRPRPGPFADIAPLLPGPPAPGGCILLVEDPMSVIDELGRHTSESRDYMLLALMIHYGASRPIHEDGHRVSPARARELRDPTNARR